MLGTMFFIIFIFVHHKKAREIWGEKKRSIFEKTLVLQWFSFVLGQKISLSNGFGLFWDFFLKTGKNN